MGRLSSDRCALAVIVTSLEDQPEFPVKNTFIHFSDECTDYKSSLVQRSKTDPSSEPRARSRLCSLESASTSGSSTPRASTEEDSAGTCPSWTQPPDWTPTIPPRVPSPDSRPASVALQSTPAVKSNSASSHWSSPYTKLDDGSVHFCFMLRRADTVEWGLDVIPDEGHQALLVQAVLPGGAIEAWNRQVMDGPKADRAILVGDRILSINSKRDCQAMVDESDSKLLLKIEVLRENATP